MTATLTVLPHAIPENREPNTSSGSYVAIVDDEESVCRAFARLLRAYSFDAQGYLSGQEFLESLSNRIPACLIVDMHLGDMNGFDVLRRIASMGMNIPAIVVTARNEPGVRREFELSSATALLSKPVRGQSLLDAIDIAMATLARRGAEDRRL